MTAFSFNRDLRFHLCHVLLTSDHLAQAIEGLTGAGPVEVEPVNNPLTDLVIGAIGLPETYFPDEYEEPRPILRLETAQDASHQLVADFRVIQRRLAPFRGTDFPSDVHNTGGWEHAKLEIALWSRVRDTNMLKMNPAARKKSGEVSEKAPKRGVAKTTG